MPNLKSKTARDRADVIAKVFKDANNRMTSKTLLWDVLSKVTLFLADFPDWGQAAQIALACLPELFKSRP